jgi:hypothetical protein
MRDLRQRFAPDTDIIMWIDPGNVHRSVRLKSSRFLASAIVRCRLSSRVVTRSFSLAHVTRFNNTNRTIVLYNVVGTGAKNSITKSHEQLRDSGYIDRLKIRSLVVFPIAVRLSNATLKLKIA